MTLWSCQAFGRGDLSGAPARPVVPVGQAQGPAAVR